MRLVPILLILQLYFLISPLSAQSLGSQGPARLDIRPEEVIIWQPVQAIQKKPGLLLLGLRLQTKDNFTIYKEKTNFLPPDGWTATVTLAPPTQKQIDPLGEGEVEVYTGGDFEVQLQGPEVKLTNGIRLGVKFLGCTEKICLFPHTTELMFPVFQETSEPESSDSIRAGEESSDPNKGSDQELNTSLSTEERLAEQLKQGGLSWPLILLIVFFGGLATNLTPCVFPMVPITLRLLASQGQARLITSIVYALGIIVTYTSLGIFASLSGGIFGSILAHPAVTLGFGLLFCLLGLTMLGFGNLSILQNFGSRLGSGQASLWNAFGMGAGAGLVAAPCTGPIMGALLAYSTSLGSTKQSIGLFALYSFGFALPYVFLGALAQQFTHYKVSAKIQIAVKMLFAAAMFGLGFFYAKNPIHHWLEAYRGNWGITALIAFILAIPLLLYLVREARTMHAKHLHIIPSLILGIGLFAGVQWATGQDLSIKMHWLKDEQKAYALASEQQKPILIDGWADWCVACKKMDQTTFQDPEVIATLEKEWVTLKLDMTEQNEQDIALGEKYQMQGLPTLVLIGPDGDLSKAKRLDGYVGRERLLEELRSFQRNR